jgi:hypothetical protein
MSITITSDGRNLLYCVFSADGYECEFLEGIFGDEKSANDFLTELRKDPHVYGDPELLEVKCIEMGKRIDPCGGGDGK